MVFSSIAVFHGDFLESWYTEYCSLFRNKGCSPALAFYTIVFSSDAGFRIADAVCDNPAINEEFYGYKFFFAVQMMLEQSVFDDVFHIYFPTFG